MPVKLLLTLILAMTCAVGLQFVDARGLRKPSSSVVTGDDDVTSSDTVVGRSAASQMRTKRRAYSRAPAVVGVPVMIGQAAARTTRPVDDVWSLLNEGERSQFATLLADAVLLDSLRNRRPTDRHIRELTYGQLDDEDLVRSMEAAGGMIYSRGDGAGLAEAGLPVKRAIGHLRSPRELHPVYLGLGQNAASAALNTYASLLADEKRRENLEQQQQSSANPVRFIGKR